jgi:hypothetical protein
MTSKQTEEQLIAKEMEIVAAGCRGDLKTIEPLLADAFLEIGSSGELYSKAEVLHAISDIPILDCIFGEFNALPVGDDCLILTYSTRMKRSHKGQEFTQHAYRSSTWVRRDGRWLLMFHQATPLPPPK